MKKLISLFTALCIMFALTACGGSAPEQPADQPQTEIENTGTPETVPTEEPAPQYPWGIEVAPMEVGVEYPYNSLCYDDISFETVGKAKVNEYLVEETDDPDRVDKTVVIHFSFDDENARSYGMSYGVIYADMADETYISGDNGILPIEIDGKEEEIIIKTDEFIYGQWLQDVYCAAYELTLNMPKDYNEFAIMLVDYSNMQDYLDEEGNFTEGFYYTDITNPDTPWFILDDGKYTADTDTAEGEETENADGTEEQPVVTTPEKNGNITITVESFEPYDGGYDFDLYVDGWQKGHQLYVFIYEPDSYSNIVEINYEIDTDEHSFGVDIADEEIAGDQLIFEFVVADSTGLDLCTEVLTVDR